MEYEIVWTPRATKDVEVSLSYLESEWSQKIAQEYFDKLRDVISLVSKFPYSFPLFKRKKVVVLTVFDNRRNPESLSL